jgi:carbonic anhydrase
MSELARRKYASHAAYHTKNRGRLGTGKQRPVPTILFIGCFDSRIIPEMMLDVGPGEMMTLRIPGALVPAQGLGDAVISGSIELTLNSMHSITDLVVCGHSDCVMLETLASGADAYRQPNLARWIAMNDFIKAQASTRADATTNPAGYIRAVLECSVERSLSSLRELDIVRQKENAKQLRLHGWLFELETGQLFALNEKTGQFEVMGTATNPIVEPVAESPTPVEIPVTTPTPSAPPIAAAPVPTSPSVNVPPLNIPPAPPPPVIIPGMAAAASVSTPSVAPTPQPPPTVAPPPVQVPSAKPVQRVYASDVTPVPQTSNTPTQNPLTARPTTGTSGNGDQQVLKPKPIIEQAASYVPNNLQEKLRDPALDDLRELMLNVRRPDSRLKLRYALNNMNTPEGWRKVGQAINELRDPQVRQALRELTVELNSSQSRQELRNILAQVDAGTVANVVGNLDAQQIQQEFMQILEGLRNASDQKK